LGVRGLPNFHVDFLTTGQPGEPRFVAQVRVMREGQVEDWLGRLGRQIHRKHFGAPAAAVDAVFASMTFSGHSASGAW
jgi:hypothetical protein